ncbi:MAG: 2-amino-4-hydroxy-6-hydroxymethyldihydropteridine diphosphokinase [Muribaculum sp.]|nr:2-amino-4-hydroxy-6-hydroxymethyldihydropteridine diphosphokinase [Muribaculum sp.]
MTVETVLSIGSNCGNRHERVVSGIEWLRGILSNLRSSSVYTTGDCHGGKRDYMNAVVIGNTNLNAAQLNELCKEYELQNGRTPEARSCGDVPIDIDVVVYEEKILRPNDYRQKFFRIGYQQLTDNM